ncbi:FAD/NAD(P)-binding domain-containing protein [Punctularia strigosozonata HHB-11173 SS5]|uniref:FAD/NAD(P)-binding domain-containing protein n=1 Tax=Punctularia strigosozonata (strain HHB-11173) TaxID=741275 RepID=R7S1L8_PUNST|nr:FAD/NAD(P)-binding domain-containing protein [Punctularia strigosozonata HHB-11173 SS5]EIN04270.1 FAD/NAD(P)-binding domain-containing protein [Punctularia strigosozonata HHB-11173 SS5]
MGDTSQAQDTVVAIVGGGLGGVCTAVGLSRAGYTIHVFEKAASFAELGAGLSIGPNSMRALELLGLGSIFEAIAKISELNPLWFRVLDGRDGTHVTDLPSNVNIHFSSLVKKVENMQTANGAYARLAIERREHGQNPSRSEPDFFVASVVVGCDGIKSVVRESLGEQCGGRVRYTGTYMYRGLINMDDAVAAIGERARISTQRMGFDRQMSAIPIDGGKTLSVTAYVSDRSRDPDLREWGPTSWIVPGSTEEMLASFEDFGEDAKTLLKLVKKADKWALHELVPPERWTVGRVTLLGDAAHAGQPFNGQGVGQAFEDAYVLAELLALPECTPANVERFLLAYEDIRKDRSRVQQVTSREGGEIFQYCGPMGRDRAAIARVLRDRFDWLWMYDLTMDVELAKAKLKLAGVIV